MGWVVVGWFEGSWVGGWLEGSWGGWWWGGWLEGSWSGVYTHPAMNSTMLKFLIL